MSRRGLDGDSRLVDYVVIAGYVHGRSRREGSKSVTDGRGGFQCQGTVLQRFPKEDWKDTPYTEGLEHFCQPNGWVLQTEKSEPKFYIAGLTDINGNRQFCAVLSFSEAVAKDDLEDDSESQADEEDDHAADNFVSMKTIANRGGTTSLPRHIVPGVSLPALAHDTILFAPKCLVLVSKHDYPEVLRNCLGVIYTAYSECLVGNGGERIKLETLIGNLLGSVYVPSANGPQIRFSLGANDKMTLQPPIYPNVPCTGTKVAFLFKQLGIRNVLTLFCAAITELKILFYSQSFMRLTDACNALVALMYPLKYTHVFIPILPSSLLEVLSTPTPFIIGVNSIHESEITDLLDIVKVDLDGGAISVPENMTINQVPPILLNKVQSELTMVLQPELAVADNAFPNSGSNNALAKKPLTSLDKELRAVVLRLVVQLLDGYRPCLTLVRIHPRPFIAFHKASFLGLRNLCDSVFMKKLLNSMFLSAFVNERGPPWRLCDIFDDFYSISSDQSLVENNDPSRVLTHIKVLAEAFFRNENPIATSNQPYGQKIPQPAEGAMTRIHQPLFPLLDEDIVNQHIVWGVEKHQLEKTPNNSLPMKFIPNGPNFNQERPGQTILTHTARRLGVLRDCIGSIFDNKIADAKKTFPAVLSAILKSKLARQALCEELQMHKDGKNQVLLEHQQFDMIVRLMNAALQDDSDVDEHGIALALLPLSTTYGRKLSKGVTQFAYTLVQGHAVWNNQQFWEASFYSDVQKGIKDLYLAMQDQNSVNNNVTNGVQELSKERSVLELAAEEIRSWDTLNEAQKIERIKAEEKTVQSQALVYINYMVYMLCSMDLATPKRHGRRLGDDFENVSNSVSNSMAESDSIDAESGFEDQEIPDNGQQVIKNISRFADKVCSESSVTVEDIKSISSMIPSTVAMHLEELEVVSSQASRLPLIQKPKICQPLLLPGEEFVIQKGLRVYLLSDGREKDNATNGMALLPAEGALFLTTYRVIFKGTPIDPFAAEHSVTRFFPVTSLTRDKRFSLNEYLNEIEQQLKDGIQLRSNTFQLIRAAFDNEVTAEDVENFRKSIQRVQFPEHLFQFFAFRGIHHLAQESKSKEKNAKYMTIKGFASKTLKNVTKATGYQNKKRKTSKYLLPNMMPTTGRLSIAEMTNHDSRLREDDEGSEVSSEIQMPIPSQSSGGNSTKSLDRLSERSYYKDWIRLGLIPNDYNLLTKSQHQNESFRVSTLNYRYNLCPSYQALILVPARISDVYLRSYARCHKHSRFLNITWRHPNNQSILLRGAGYHNKGVMGMIRRHQDNGSTGGQHELSNVDADVFLDAVIKVTPRAMVKLDSAGWNMSGSQLSINSLIYASAGGSNNDYSAVHNYPTLTPSMARKMNPLSKAMDTLTRSAAPPKFSRISMNSMKSTKTLGSQSSLATSSSTRGGGGYRYSESEPNGEAGIGNFLQKTALYVFADKSQIKGIRLEARPKTEYIPVDYPEPRRIRASFKKLMRACVPSNVINQPDQTFLKMVESSEWLSFLQMIMQLAGAVVDLMDIQAASVSLCLEDGWDVTAQISSIAMLCLDPYYRTIEGFRILVEKEWLGLGHRFNHRSDLSQPNQDSGFTPIFLQFLDVVHQILSQFPLAFEFNQFYLKFLAYHHISCRFRTFLLDNEMQRCEVGFMAAEEKSSSSRPFRPTSQDQGAHSSDDEFLPFNPPSPVHNNYGIHVFDYIEYHANRSPVFHNFEFAPDLSDTVIRPFSHISDLKIWDYFIHEELRHGAAYDFEIYAMNLQQEEDFHASDSMNSHAATGRDSLSVGYDCLDKCCLSSFTELMIEINQLEVSAGHSPRNWQYHWNRVEPPPVIPPRDRNVTPVAQTTPSLTAKHHGRLMHKRSTMELILKGKIGAHASAVEGGVKGGSYSHSHHFEKYNYSTPTSCDVCSSLLWGPVKTGLRCADCGYNCHDKCRENVSKSCSRYRSVQRENTTDHLDNNDKNVTSFAREHNVNSQDDDDDLFPRFPPSSDENSKIICQGYLFKQANFRIKGWKQRWFVLDATKHQLRYYDTREDFQCKGLIDLSEVIKIMEGSAPQAGAPKKSEDGCYFDLNTLKRTFCFCAESTSAANEWIKKIQSCLSS